MSSTIPTTTDRSFICLICWEEKHNRLKMPESSLGCNCGKDICVQCFLTDFDNRKVPLWLNEHGMSLWEDPIALSAYLVVEFNIENELETVDEAYAHPKFEEYLLANFHIGKKCPFCCQTVVWKLDKVPQIIEGRLTFHAPFCVQPLPLPASEPLEE